MWLEITEICLLTKQNYRYSFTICLFYLFFAGFDCHDDGCEDLYLLEYNAVDSQMTFQKLLVSCLVYYSTLKMEMICFSETSPGFH
jgi:hypothetical protein